MWALRVVVPSPLLNDDPGFIEAVEDLSVQELIAEPGIEALTVSVLPRRPRFDVGGLGTDSLDPLPDRIRDELRSVIRSYVGRNTPDDEQVGQGINHIRRVELPLHPDRQAFAAELIDDVQRSVGSPVFCSVMHEVVRPDMVNMPGPETDARSVIEPEPAFPRLLHGNLQPLTTPQALDPLVVQLPACLSQHRRDPSIPVTAVLPGQFNHVPDQEVLVISRLRNITVCRTMLSQDTTGTAFRYCELAPHQINAVAPPCGA